MDEFDMMAEQVLYPWIDDPSYDSDCVEPDTDWEDEE